MLVNIQALLDEAKCYEVVRQSREDESGASGAGINLPIHTEIYSMAQRQEFDVLIVRGIARLSRNRAKQLIVEQELRRVGVRIEYVIGEYPDSPEGDLPKPIWARGDYARVRPAPCADVGR